MLYDELHSLGPDDIAQMDVRLSDVDAWVDQCRQKWLDRNVAPDEIFSFSLERHGASADQTITCDWKQFYTKFLNRSALEQRKWYALVMLCEKTKRFSDSSEGTESYESIAAKDIMERAERVMHDCREAVILACTARMNMLEETSHVVKKTAPARCISTAFTDTNRNDFQNVIRWVVRDMQRNCVRKRGGDIFTQKIVNGFVTGFWQRDNTVKRYIQEACTERNYDVWKMLVSNRDRTPEVATYIAESVQPRVPDLDIDRYKVAFRDGVYMLKQDTFWKFAERAFWPRIADRINAEREVVRETLRRDHNQILSLSLAEPPNDELGAINFFDQDFNAWDEQEDPCQLECPETDKILHDQHLNADTIEWFYAFTARLWYELGELDNWQCAMTIVGVAKNGKSSWQKMSRSFYPPEYVKNIGGRPEETFGPASIANAYLCCVPELKRGFEKRFDTADLQCMLTGEELSYARKYLDAITKKWTCNFFFCGNEYAEWASTAGSMERRLMPFEWPHRLERADPTLIKNALKRMGPFIRKANAYYHVKLTECAQMDITGNRSQTLSPQMCQFCRKMEKAVNKFLCFVSEFLDEKKYEIGEGTEFDNDDYNIPLSVMRADYANFRREKHLSTVTWDDDVYMTTFQTLGLRTALETRDVDGATTTTWFVKGIRVC
tara:strand:+ start:1301 stop:3298 length:1998 start_codon:yes stop_codon:yes gene_type:complete